MPEQPQGWLLEATYTQLPERFFARVQPFYSPRPTLIVFNDRLAEEVGLDSQRCAPDDLAEVFSGNRLPAGCHPYAQAYAGHQFGHFTMLGDGRALMLGEQITPSHERRDVQLKGAGQTPYSRRGDGKATLESMLREYLMSETMHHLGVSSSRSLAVVSTGDEVFRETPSPGAVLTRVMSSHIRVGTFEFARQFGSLSDLEALLVYTTERHYGDLIGTESLALAFIDRVMERQIALVTDWLRVGFVHGVMNTDNTSVTGETFDYGPCAFMNAFDQGTVFSSIDAGGRYAFGRQPAIVHWNLSCLAGALLPLIDDNQQIAIERAQALLNTFKDRFERAWLTMMRGKLGLNSEAPGDRALADELLQWMQTTASDYTNTFASLTHDRSVGGWKGDAAFADWRNRWEERIKPSPGGMSEAKRIMQGSNPFIIARNHRVEEALESASEANDLAPFRRLLEALVKPYDYNASLADLTIPPVGGDEGYLTYCGT